MDEGGRSAGEATGTVTDAPDASLVALIDEHSPAVYRLARSIVRDPGLSDDVTQETFIKVWKHRGDFRGEGSMRGWILRIAHREAISAMRRTRDHATDPERLDHPANVIPVSRVVESRVAMDGFRAALDHLDELSRAVLVLREIEGMSYDEIASTVGVPVSTVKTRLLRARRTMSIKLEGWRP